MNKPLFISKRTFQGTLLIFLTLAGVFVLPDVLMSFTTAKPVKLAQLPVEYREKIRRSKRNYRSEKSYSHESRYHAPPARFDPNRYTVEEWMALGLSEKQAASVVKFTSHGVYSVSDVEKIFVIPDQVFALMRDSLYFPEKPAVAKQPLYESVAERKGKVDLNTASEEELLKVKGIGPFFARQIIRTREQLGGFVRVEQLLDVWKMDEEKYSVIVSGVTTGAANLRKINLNTATVEELKSHPYITWNLANSIVKLRTQNGGFTSVGGIKKSALMNEELFEKLAPYLTVEE